MNTFYVSKRNRIFRQHNIPILELTNRIKLDTIHALVFDEHGGGHCLPVLCGNDKKHRTESDGHSQWQHFISIAGYHSAKIHNFEQSLFCPEKKVFLQNKTIKNFG